MKSEAPFWPKCTVFEPSVAIYFLFSRVDFDIVIIYILEPFIAPTPFDDGGAIDDGSIDTMVEFFLSAGADGLTIMGMMGEAEKLTQDESVAVMTRVLPVPGGPCTRTTRVLV